MSEEHRHFIRLDIRALTFYKVLKTGIVRRTLTKDVSGGGLCFKTDAALEMGTALEVEVKLPDREQPIQFAAEVVWSRPVERTSSSSLNTAAETGVRIVRIDPKEQALLMQYASLNAPPASGRT